MAACRSFHQIFDSPVPENPSLIESLSSWSHIKSTKPPIDHSSFTEIFGELHFKENCESSTLPPILSPNLNPNRTNENQKITPSVQDSFPSFPAQPYKNSDINFSAPSSSMNPESLQLCTEGLGFESFDDIEDLTKDTAGGGYRRRNIKEEKANAVENSAAAELRRSRGNRGGGFPPPISCIGKTGKPWVSFKSYRQDGRFVLKEIRVPTREFLHAYREDGRLRLHFVHPEEEEEDGGEDEDEEEDQEEGNGDEGCEEEQEEGDNIRA